MKEGGSGGSLDQKEHIDQLIRQNDVLHEAIIDLYLQVKIRSNEEVSNHLTLEVTCKQIDNFNEGQFSKERERLLKFDSLTVLDYIRTSIEILMQMKLDEEKLAAATTGLNDKAKQKLK